MRTRNSSEHPGDAHARQGVSVAFEHRGVDALKPANELFHVRADIPALGYGPLLRDRENAIGEEAHLVAEVIDVVLAHNPVSRRLQQARNGIAKDGSPRVAYVQRPSRIRADELHVDTLAARARC